MENLLSQVREITVIDAEIQKEDRSEVDIAELLRRIVEGFRLREKDRVVFDLDTGDKPLVLHASEDRLLQVFENILDNAVSFAPRGSTVTVNAAAADRRLDGNGQRCRGGSLDCRSHPRSRRRHPQRKPRPHLRSVLHLPSRRAAPPPPHRPRTLDREGDRRGLRRQRHRRERAGRGSRVRSEVADYVGCGSQVLSFRAGASPHPYSSPSTRLGMTPSPETAASSWPSSPARTRTRT